MGPIKDLITAPDEWLDFLERYVDQVRGFRFTVEHYRGEYDNLAIRNQDLWIESYIDIIPELQEFRDHVRSEMSRLGVDRHPLYVYNKKNNHYYYSNKHTIEKLKICLRNYGNK